jgi:fumarylacetoacetate (FAA) hydrolase
LRLVTFAPEPGAAPRVGELLSDGTVVQHAATSMVQWLAGSGRELLEGSVSALDAVRLLAPLPVPPSIRDFYAYEGHVRAGFARREREIPEAWYQAPAFYFTNPAAVHGPGEAVTRPGACTMLDFELEIAVAIGAGGAIEGFMLMNDWSARDIQAREMTVGLGPAKGKDFATSLGPWLVTPEELPFDGERLDLEATVEVNGAIVARAAAKPMHFSWPELVAQAARDTLLQPGDVLGSGTLSGGCLLELGPIDGHWIEPGDEVVLSAPGLGKLRTTVR